jgi:hypothetical protein
MLKKCISVLLVLTVLLTFTCASAFAGNDDDGGTADLTHHPTQPDPSGGSGTGTTPGSGSTGGGGGSGGGGSGTGNDSQPEERWLEVGRSDIYTETHTTTRTETLYYNWYQESGPGTMSVISSNGPVSPSSNGWHAGNTVTAYFSAKGDYMVISQQWGKDITTTTETQKQDLIIEHITYDLSGNFIHTSEIVRQPVQIGSPVTTTTESEPYVISTEHHPVRIPEPGEYTIPEEHILKTKASAIFSRNYVYTERCTDAATNRPFELEVVYDFSCNTTITEILPPTHTITRYQGNGTMTITPKEFRILEGKEGENHVKIRAKFIYPKAAMPGKSPMKFTMKVKTQNKGDKYEVSEEIDVPVNTYNLRFTSLPDSERGKFYPIPGLSGTFGNYRYAWDKGFEQEHVVVYVTYKKVSLP